MMETMASHGDPPYLGPDLAYPSRDDVDVPEGLVAVGGDLRPDRLVEAYRRGVFPWPLDEGLPLMWWSPDPRFVLRPDELHVGRTLRTRVRSGDFDVRFDTDFAGVVAGCAETRRTDGLGTWITRAMRDAYVELHRRGVAHSVESWRDGRLVGGLYGLSIGAVFFGESMFFSEPDASKVAFATFVPRFAVAGGELIDCQMETEHLTRFGGRSVDRDAFLAELTELTERPDAFAALLDDVG